MFVTNKLKEIYTDTKEIVKIPKNIGPYRPYDLKIFEIHPSDTIDNKSNKIILDCFYNLASDKFFDPIVKGRDPLGLEIYSDSKETIYHVLLPHENVKFMITKLYSIFQGSTIVSVDSKDNYLKNFSQETADVYHINSKSHPFMPFRTDMTPFAKTITESLEILEEGDLACIQMLFQPIESDWESSCRYASQKFFTSGKMPPFGFNMARYAVYYIEKLLYLIRSVVCGEMELSSKNFNKDIVKAIDYKLKGNGFRTSLRVAVQSENPSKRSMMSKAIASSFNVINNYNETRIIRPLKQKKAFDNFKTRAISPMNTITMSATEVSNLYALPDPTTKTHKLKRTTPDEEEVDPRVIVPGLRFGKTLPYKNRSYFTNFTTDIPIEVNKLLLVAAPPGYGKSTLIEVLVNNAMALGWGNFVADVADGTMALRVLQTLKPAYNPKTIYFDFTNKERLPKLSVDSFMGSPRAKAMMYADWFAQLMKVSDKNAPKAYAYLKKYSLSCFMIPGNSLLEFKMLLDGNADFIKKTVAKLKKANPELYMWWTREYPKKKDEIDSSLEVLRYRLESLLDDPITRTVFCSTDNVMQPRKWMDEGYTVIVNLAEGDDITKDTQQAIMSFMVLMLWSAAKSRQDLTNAGIEPKPFKIHLDEPDGYLHVTDTMENALTKFRKYGCGANAYFHDAQQFIKNAPNLWNAFLSNEPHMLFGDVPVSTIEKIKEKFLEQDKQTLIKLFSQCNAKDHTFVANIYNHGHIKPFLVNTINRKDATLYDKSQVIKDSLKKYAPNTIDECEEDYFLRKYNMSKKDYYAMISDNKTAVKGGEKWVSNAEGEVKETHSLI